MRLSSKLVTFIAAAAILLVPPALADDAGAALDGLVRQKMGEAGIVGLGAAIIVDKQVVWSKGYGFADKARQIPFTPDTIMNIGSISKTFTGAAVMRAVQEGKLSLDENINTYLPFPVVNPRFPREAITLRQLATHTSGITDRWEVYEGVYDYSGDAPLALGDFLRDYFAPDGKHYDRANYLNVKPGTHREYSNIGAALAGYIVELATGEKLSQYTRRHFFTPLNMRRTGWSLADVPLDQHAKLYVSQGGISIPIPLYGIATYPDGGVRTSVSDLSAFFIALLNGGAYRGVRILTPAAAAEMQRFQFTAANRPANVSLQKKNSGIFWQSMFDVTKVGHGGSDPGIKTEMLADLSGEVGVILFTNTSLCEQDTPKYAAIFDALWRQALALQRAGRAAANQ
ncbi:serine hydrolase [Duganella sp. FT94W]|uniref:Serine hydrolase n=1 Tax=Duganella lactea TaxID=2692173 RepID=A0ABW9VAL1_9BURK|nr:serine hydrolase domain-containing protein [Duganella lactea]MYM36658.1 serine hydrolase [Duganella lactea]